MNTDAQLSDIISEFNIISAKKLTIAFHEIERA